MILITLYLTGQDNYHRLKPFSLNLGKVKDGKLQTVHNTRELFRIWKNKKEDVEITQIICKLKPRKYI